MSERVCRDGERDLVRQRQRYAWERVRYWDAETATRVQSLTVQLRAQGLSTTVAVLLREARPPARKLLDLMAGWLLDASPLQVLEPKEGHRGQPRLDGMALLECCLSLELAEQSAYLSAQADAMALICEAKLLASATHPSEVHGGA